MRLLHLPGNVAGLPLGLVEGERMLGHEARLLTLTASPFGYPADFELRLDEKSRLSRWWTYASTLARITHGYDGYCFSFGQSLLHYPERDRPLLELPLYSRSARKAFLFQGCDVRQKDRTVALCRQGDNPFAACLADDCYGGACLGGSKDRQRRVMIERAARYADCMFAVNPDLLRLLPPERARYLPYTIAHFHQIETRSTPMFADGRIHIVHGTTERVAKGTDIILRAIDAIKERFPHQVRFTLVEGLPYDQARRVFATADLYIDQMRIGWYGGVAVELMKMGIPVLCHVDESQLALIPEDQRDIPIVRATPDQLVSVLTDLIRNRDQLAEVATSGLDFVNRVHAPEKVALQLITDLFGPGEQAP